MKHLVAIALFTLVLLPACCFAQFHSLDELSTYIDLESLDPVNPELMYPGDWISKFNVNTVVVSDPQILLGSEIRTDRLYFGNLNVVSFEKTQNLFIFIIPNIPEEVTRHLEITHYYPIYQNFLALPGIVSSTIFCGKEIMPPLEGFVTVHNNAEKEKPVSNWPKTYDYWVE